MRGVSFHGAPLAVSAELRTEKQKDVGNKRRWKLSALVGCQGRQRRIKGKAAQVTPAPSQQVGCAEARGGTSISEGSRTYLRRCLRVFVDPNAGLHWYYSALSCSLSSNALRSSLQRMLDRCRRLGFIIRGSCSTSVGKFPLRKRTSTKSAHHNGRFVTPRAVPDIYEAPQHTAYLHVEDATDPTPFVSLEGQSLAERPSTMVVSMIFMLQYFDVTEALMRRRQVASLLPAV